VGGALGLRLVGAGRVGGDDRLDLCQQTRRLRLGHAPVRPRRQDHVEVVVAEQLPVLVRRRGEQQLDRLYGGTCSSEYRVPSNATRSGL
jgi:hypothetical protein